MATKLKLSIRTMNKLVHITFILTKVLPYNAEYRLLVLKFKLQASWPLRHVKSIIMKLAEFMIYLSSSLPYTQTYMQTETSAGYEFMITL